MNYASIIAKNFYQIESQHLRHILIRHLLETSSIDFKARPDLEDALVSVIPRFQDGYPAGKEIKYLVRLQKERDLLEILLMTDLNAKTIRAVRVYEDPSHKRIHTQ